MQVVTTLTVDLRYRELTERTVLTPLLCRRLLRKSAILCDLSPSHHGSKSTRCGDNEMDKQLRLTGSCRAGSTNMHAIRIFAIATKIYVRSGDWQNRARLEYLRSIMGVTAPSE